MVKLPKEKLQEIEKRFEEFNDQLVKDYGVYMRPTIMPVWDIAPVKDEHLNESPSGIKLAKIS